ADCCAVRHVDLAGRDLLGALGRVVPAWFGAVDALVFVVAMVRRFRPAGGLLGIGSVETRSRPARPTSGDRAGAAAVSGPGTFWPSLILAPAVTRAACFHPQPASSAVRNSSADRNLDMHSDGRHTRVPKRE